VAVVAVPLGLPELEPAAATELRAAANTAVAVVAVPLAVVPVQTAPDQQAVQAVMGR
jgi:hypothetical protein